MAEGRNKDNPLPPGGGDTVAARRRLQAAKLAEVARVVRALAHESRNALQRAQACLSLLRLKVNDQPDLLALVDEAEQAQERLVALYDQVREFARVPVLRCQSVALDALVTQVWDQLAGVRSHRLDLDVQCGNSCCQADPLVLGAALNALLTNAVEATAAGSTVSVEVADADIDGVAGICVTVRDEGPGLQAEHRERLFELFYTTKPGHDGLGLARAREQIESHGGHLTLLDAETGGGARFRLLLPRGP